VLHDLKRGAFEQFLAEVQHQRPLISIATPTLTGSALRLGVAAQAKVVMSQAAAVLRLMVYPSPRRCFVRSGLICEGRQILCQGGGTGAVRRGEKSVVGSDRLSR